MVEPHEFGRETPSIPKRKPIRVFVEPRLDRLVVVRTEPYEPRLVGRGVGYWRIGGAHQWKNTLVRNMRIRKRPQILHVVSFENRHAMWVAYRASERWWKHHVARPGWQVCFDHRTTFSKRYLEVDCDRIVIEFRNNVKEYITWKDVRRLTVSPSGNQWAFETYTGVRQTVRTPTGAMKAALRHVADQHFPNAVQEQRRRAKATGNRITIACLIGSIAHTGILLWFFGNIPLVWFMSFTFPPLLIAVLPLTFIKAVYWKHNWVVSYQRKHRRRATTPLPSPTTPKDPQT